MKRAFAGLLGSLLGRRNLARLGRLLSNEARLDVPNDMRTNGELMVQRQFLNHADPGEGTIVFDVGANLGAWTAALLEEAVASGRVTPTVYAFEPCAGTFRMLGRELAQLAPGARVHSVQLALADFEGEADFVVSEDGAGSNGLAAAAPGPDGHLEKVRVTTLDRFCAERGIERIALLKIDAEGFDLHVLRGAKGLLAEHRIDLVQFEYNQKWIDTRNFLRDAFAFFEPLGYAVGKITPRAIEFYDRWHFELEMWREANFLACPPDHRSWFRQIPWWNAG